MFCPECEPSPPDPLLSEMSTMAPTNPRQSHPPDRPANRLAGETSPYLLQHAHNPVNWYPWGPGRRSRPAREPADLPVDRLFGLPLVPRDGTRELRERRDCCGHERALHQCTGACSTSTEPPLALPASAARQTRVRVPVGRPPPRQPRHRAAAAPVRTTRSRAARRTSYYHVHHTRTLLNAK